MPPVSYSATCNSKGALLRDNLSQAFSKAKLVYYLMRYQKHTVQLQWLEHLLNYENMFEIGLVRANECKSKRKVKRHNRDILSIFFNLKLCCVCSLESPHRGDSYEYTQYTVELQWLEHLWNSKNMFETGVV